MTSARLFAATVLATWLAAPVHALTLFSIDATSPSTAFVSPADILSPGPIGGPPGVAIPFMALGLVPGDDVDAISYILPRALPVYFSVDRATVGAPGLFPPNVFTEASVGQAAGDIYIGLPPSSSGNTLATNQDLLGLLPPFPPALPATSHTDNLDALEELPGGLAPTPTGLLYSLAPGSPTLVTFGYSPADILTTVAGVPSVYLAAATLFLVPTDDVDGLMVGPGVPATLGIAFSLAPGSPSLGMALSPADILGAGPGGPVPILPASALGLGLPGAADNVNAIAAVPEPETWVMLLAGLGLVGWVGMRRKTSQH